MVRKPASARRWSNLDFKRYAIHALILCGAKTKRMTMNLMVNKTNWMPIEKEVAGFGSHTLSLSHGNLSVRSYFRSVERGGRIPRRKSMVFKKGPDRLWRI
jgi:hypothetical protein